MVLAALVALAAIACSESPKATPVQFQIVNPSDRPVFLQADAFWSLVRGGMTLRQETCAQCYCDRCSRCAVCGLAPPTVEEIPAGASKSFMWGGSAWPIDQAGCGGISCQREELVPPGPVELRITYSFSHETNTTQGYVQDLLGEAIHVNTPFVHPPPGPVVVTVE